VIQRLATRGVQHVYVDGGSDVKLRHIETRTYPRGLVQSHYEVQ
jgi:hypothetical protein